VSPHEQTAGGTGQTVGLVPRRASMLDRGSSALDVPADLAAHILAASGNALPTADGRRRCVLSIVVPAYNEQDNVGAIYTRLVGVLDSVERDWELIFSVDPCTDRTEELILELCAQDPRVKMLRFSRRFGQPMATMAGLEEASGDAVVVVDCDLQDPPELIPELVLRWREGYDVVYAQRRTRAGETLPKRIV
jgi:cellulose synthase/poly-beta-1,6-N-acetylglucosamine synthase-like glycosyltransferase